MKKNVKLIIGIIIGITIGALSGVYATLTYNAGDIAYTKSGSSTQISVASALNELYQNKKETTDDTKSITANGNITLDKYYKNLNVNVPIPEGYVQTSGTKKITTKANNIDVSNFKYADTTGLYTASEYAAKTGEGVYWKKGTFTPDKLAGGFTVNLGFKPKTIYIYGGDYDANGVLFKMVIYYDGENFVQYNGNNYEFNSVNEWLQITSTGFKNNAPWTSLKGIEYNYLASYN